MSKEPRADALTELSLPAGYDTFPDLLATPAHNVAHLYSAIAEQLEGQRYDAPTFADGLNLQRTLAALTA